MAELRSTLVPCLTLAGVIVVWLAGCASVPHPSPQAPAGTSQPQPATTAPGTPVGALPVPAPAGATGEPAVTAGGAGAAAPDSGGAAADAAAASLPPVSGNRAVIALVERSRTEAGSGRRESAGASLERALRIEPRNAWLWHELARLRLAQGQYAQAVSLAKKSTSLAVRERILQALNWHLIADARIAQGDSAAAAQARQRAEDLQRP